MSTDDAKRLKALELENGKLKKLLAERMLDIEVLKDVNSKNGERVRSSRAGCPRSNALATFATTGVRAVRTATV